MKTELKPCPFCGVTPTLEPKHGDAIRVIVCKSDLCQGSGLLMACRSSDVESGVNVWNTRSEHAALQATLAQAQAELEAFLKSDLESTRREMAAIVHVVDLSERLRKAEQENEDMNELLSSLPVDSLWESMTEMSPSGSDTSAPAAEARKHAEAIKSFLTKLTELSQATDAHKGDKA